MATRVQLFRILQDLDDRELRNFKWLLQQDELMNPFPAIQRCQLESADRPETVDQMVQTYGTATVEVTRRVLREMNKNDLVQRLLDSSSRTQGTTDGRIDPTTVNTPNGFLLRPEDGAALASALRPNPNLRELEMSPDLEDVGGEQWLQHLMKCMSAFSLNHKPEMQ
ncbi:uncharacterized protein LOC115370992 isoform X2 [Myripristis murdjan]|uniref:uncharacterized protein LOC115370992 isoform X2 n=1 Tax=Myripristis murdjan TaxID=586833 RepID=UPI0011761C3B|nr:uncharacterized protein LOC115370992 isoform X2 [Myripristis murdjan]